MIDAPDCSAIVGQVFTAEQWGQGCIDGERIEATGFVDCKDGRRIYWNAGGWAYIGEAAQPVENGAVPGSVYWGNCLQIES